MTGYGRGVAEQDGRRVVVEIRSVNHRFLDLKLRGAVLEPALEERLSSAIRGVCQRGAVTASVRTERRGAAAALRVDVDAARRVHADLASLAGALGVTEPVSLALVCAQPGVMVADEEGADADVVAACLDRAMAEALDGLARMREAEGRALASDLGARLDRLVALAGEIGAHAASTVDDAQRRLEERVARLLKKSQLEVDDARLAQEVALLADRLDVTEELVRLGSHLDQARALLAEPSGPVGRRLDFLVQELGRELNTVASKSQSADITRVAVEARAELERVREQVQNIE